MHIKTHFKLFSFFCLLFGTLSAQTADSTKTKHLAIGIGIPYHYFRDKVSSDLAYKGFGLAGLNISKIKVNPNKSVRQLDIYFGLGTAKPDLDNKTGFNKSATIPYYNFSYAYLKHLANRRNQSLHFYAGGKILSDAQYIIYPTVNNVRAYNFNWLSLQASAMASYEINIRKSVHQFWYQLSIPVLGINARPLSYNGLIPNESIWNQSGSALRTYFTDLKMTSVHNNFSLQSNLSWAVLIKKNKLRLSYNWLYQHNNVSVNTLNSVRSSLMVSYLFYLKNRVKK
jgi:hypothetical protein